MTPFFSVVLPTYGRGRHLRPTIESVLRQTFTDFELIVVGDGCSDETEETVRSFGSQRVSWLNLPQNNGSQSYPNNAGIEKARGSWIAYIGHDDIWGSRHLQALSELIRSDSDLDFAVSGCFFYRPDNGAVHAVTGIFDADAAKFESFFPPSSLAHRSDVTARIGGWRDPRIIAAPVDCEYLLRAAHAGLRFASTGRITAHKFAAGHRYLSYLRQESTEQWAALADTRLNDDEHLLALLEDSKRQLRFMTIRYPDFSKHEPGELFHGNRVNKGIARPPLRPIAGSIRIPQTGEPRGLDWYGLEVGPPPYRWSGPSDRPKILIPYTSEEAVQITLLLPKVASTAPADVSMSLNGDALPFEVRMDGDGSSLVARTLLQKSGYSILALHTPRMYCERAETGRGDPRSRGIAVGDILIEFLA